MIGDISLSPTHSSPAAPAGSTRGIAVSEIAITPSQAMFNATTVRIKGILNNGGWMTYSIATFFFLF